MRDNKVDSLLVIDKQRKLLGYITLEYIRKIKEKYISGRSNEQRTEMCFGRY